MDFTEIFKRKEKFEQLEVLIKTLKEEQQTAELAFIQDHNLNITDFAEIEDEKEFYRLLEEFHSLPDIIALFAKIRSTEVEIRKAEDELLEAIISISPDDIAAGIRRFFHIHTFRQKTIAIFMKRIRDL